MFIQFALIFIIYTMEINLMKMGRGMSFVDVITQQSPLLNVNVIVGGENTLIIKRSTK